MGWADDIKKNLNKKNIYKEYVGERLLSATHTWILGIRP